MQSLTPTSEADLAEAVAAASASGTPLEIAGGGTRAALGHPVQAEQTLSVAGLSGITLYEPGALTLVAQAGTPVAEIEAALEAEGQMLAFEPPDHRTLLGTEGTPTIGGAVAVAASGPRRIQRGACRDFMLGVRFVDGQGQAVSNGGRVMKNVTGYDLVKLMAGSYGTLGVLSEISFKVLPKPEATAMLSIAGLDDHRGVAALADAMGSPFDVSGAAHLPVGPDGSSLTLIRLEGLEGSVKYRAAELSTLLGAHGAVEVDHDPAHSAELWQDVRDGTAFAGQPSAVWRLSVKPSDGPKVVAALRAEMDVGTVVYDWAGGLVWLSVPEGSDAGATHVRAQTTQHGGHATLMRASPTIRAAVDVFEPEAAPIARISRGLRAKFDPKGILNPGRMR
jgi:glycolate oxidase FAD binding subunit